MQSVYYSELNMLLVALTPATLAPFAGDNSMRGIIGRLGHDADFNTTIRNAKSIERIRCVT